MAQLELFAKKSVTEFDNKWQLFVDGASRNNPGKSGAGIFIKKNNKVYDTRAFYLELKTNNEAEYLALILGLMLLKKNISKNDFLEIVSDSKLLVNQINRDYKVKHPRIQKLFSASIKLLDKLNYEVIHVLRDNNKDADNLANEAIDKRSKIPQELLSELNSYGISI